MQVETLEALKAAAEKATQGEWTAELFLRYAKTEPGTSFAVWGPDGDAIALVYERINDEKEEMANARFIAAASPETILTLLSTLSATQRERDELRKSLEIAIEDISDMDRGATYKASAYISSAKRRLSGDYFPEEGGK